MLTEIKLYGALEAKYGAIRRYAISSPREAIKALDANIPGFFDTIRDMELRVVYSSGHNPDGPDSMDLGADADLLRMRTHGGTLHIIPMPAGSMAQGVDPLAKVATGLLIIAAIIIAPYAVGALLGVGAGATVTITSFAGIAMSTWGYIGAAITLGGLGQMLAPQPPAGDPNAREDTPASTVFNSRANVGMQGQPVPVIYGGPIRVGSVVVSAGFNTDQLVVAPGTNYDYANEPNLPGDFWTWTENAGGGTYNMNDN